MYRIGVLAIAVLMTSCGASKMTQCNSIAKVTKDAEAAATKFAESSKTNPANVAKSLTDMSTKSQEFSKVMQALEIKDEKLTGFQSRFVTMYQDYDKSFVQMSSATEAKNAQAGDKALSEIQAISAKEDVLVKEFTAYCTGK